MAKRPYHKYVYDEENRTLVGKFEEMYANEDAEGFDAWLQSDLTHLHKQLSFTILSRYNFSRILDIGCGGGVFTHLLKKNNNEVIGTDISRTIISKAQARYESVKFLCARAEESLKMPGRFELIVLMEVLSLLKEWRNILKIAARKTEYVYIALYLPPNPIGFVKSFDELRAEVRKHFTVEHEVICDGSEILLLCTSKKQRALPGARMSVSGRSRNASRRL